MDTTEFDKFAEEYAEVHKGVLGPSGEDPEFFARYKIVDVARLIRAAGLPEDARILDFGCGVGNSVPWFREQLPQARLTAVDVSRKSLDVAAGRFPDGAEYLQFDGQTIPRDEGSFDVAFSACVFHHIEARYHVDLLRELRRILAPGGLLVIFEHNTHNPLTVKAVKDCAFDENAVLIPSKLFRARLREAGFAEVRSDYRIFFPRMLRWFRPLEAAMRWLPLGAQYYVSARRR